MQSQPARARLRDRARRPALGARRLRDLDRNRRVRARQPSRLLRRIAECRRAGAPRRRHLLVLDRNLETRASFAIDATAAQEYEIPPDPDLLAAIKQGVTSGQLNGDRRQRARHRAARARSGAVRRAARSSTAPAPASRRAGSRSRAPSRPTVVERMGRFSPWPVTGYPGRRTWIAPACPTRCATGCARSPLTANLLTRVAGRNHINGYLILRDQLGTPVWLVQLEIPRSAFAQAHAHHALPDHPAGPAGRRLHHRRDAAGGALAPPQRRPPGARVALPRHHRTGAGRLAGGRRAHRRDRRCQPGRAAAARLHARRTARPLGAVGAARPERFAGSGDRDAGARRAQPRHRAGAVAQGRPADRRRSELRAHRVAATAAWCPT